MSTECSAITIMQKQEQRKIAFNCRCKIKPLKSREDSKDINNHSDFDLVFINLNFTIAIYS